MIRRWHKTATSAGGGGGLRLASGFKKRRGVPGWHTALDEEGLLFGKPPPPGWIKGGVAPAAGERRFN